MSDKPKTAEMPPIEEILAGNAFRDTMVPKADGHVLKCPIWHGWVIMDAFLAGIQWERNREKL
jgi:hypothetical protein